MDRYFRRVAEGRVNRWIDTAVWALLATAVIAVLARLLWTFILI